MTAARPGHLQGVFVRDHVRWREPVVEVADPWIPLAAVATSTERVRPGPMVTPLARRRPVKVARGDRDAGPAQRWPADARGRPWQRPFRR